VQSQFKSDSGPADLDQKEHRKAAMSAPVRSKHLAIFFLKSKQKASGLFHRYLELK
jgi:hypothetical protein